MNNQISIKFGYVKQSKATGSLIYGSIFTFPTCSEKNHKMLPGIGSRLAIPLPSARQLAAWASSTVT